MSLTSALLRMVCNNLAKTKTMDKEDKLMWKYLNRQRKIGQFCDVTIKCGESTFYAHTCILASVCAYFRVLFTTNPDESQDPLVANFDIFEEETVDLLLNILYRQLDVDKMNVIEMLRLAEFIQCDWLIEVLVKAIRPLINESNASIWYEIAKDCGNKKLAALTYSYIQTNCPDLILVNDVNNKSIYKKDVVLLQNLSESAFYLLDCKKNTCEKYEDGPCAIKYEEKLVKMLFMHKNDLIVVSDDLSPVGPFVNVLIEKYDFCCQTYQLIESFTLEDKIPDRYCGEDPVLDEMAYNYNDSLYMLFVSGGGDKYDFIFKFNLTKYDFCENFIKLDHDAHHLFVECKQIGTLLIKNIETVYNIEAFNFNYNRFRQCHNINKLSFQPIEKLCHNTRTNAKRLVKYPWHAASLNGEVYIILVVGPGFCLFRLFAEQPAWHHLCGFAIYCEPMILATQGKLFILCENSCACVKNIYKITYDFGETFLPICKCKGGDGTNLIFNFDPDSWTLERTGIQLPSNEAWTRIFNIPSYVLL